MIWQPGLRKKDQELKSRSIARELAETHGPTFRRSLSLLPLQFFVRLLAPSYSILNGLPFLIQQHENQTLICSANLFRKPLTSNCELS